MMVHLPWEIVASFVGLWAIQQILSHLRHVDCGQRVDLARREGHREYRELYVSARLAAAEDHKKESE